MMDQVVRLYLGYLGNLGERVPELAGFWLLTILLQLPMQVFIKAAQCTSFIRFLFAGLPPLQHRPGELASDDRQTFSLVLQTNTMIAAIWSNSEAASEFN